MVELKSIDTSVAEALEQAMAELETLEKRLAKLEERRGSVSPEVYERVHADYQERKTSLEEEAAPLAEKAREYHGLISAQLESLEGAAKELALEKEELNLRQELGEYSKEEFESRMEALEAKIHENGAELDEARRLQGLFQMALREETPETAGEEDEGNTLTQPVLELDEPGAPAAAGAEDEAAAASLAKEPTAFEEPGPSSPGGDLAGEDEAPSFGMEEPSPDSTVFIQWPRLVGQAPDGSTVEHPVAGSRTTLGRDPENDIVLTGKKVSKHHAEIVLVEDGFEIRDLESTAGTLVNGVQITARKLANGDSVQLGDVVLVFMES